MQNGVQLIRRIEGAYRYDFWDEKGFWAAAIAEIHNFYSNSLKSHAETGMMVKNG